MLIICVAAIAILSAGCSSHPSSEEAGVQQPSTAPIMNNTEEYEGVILSDSDMSEWTPSEDDIAQFEKGFREYLVSQSKEAEGLEATSHSAENFTYILDHFNAYKRQYVGVIESGEKVVYCNLLIDDNNNSDWKNDLVLVMDGGPRYFSIRFYVKKERYFDLMIHGYA
ncbi:hypothetical protein [Paenibacillus sp. MMS18-CY102]|uniref:hypothetical protein n=1 Tax=Paenibacillus sp. MMS18-CY102 TaxID=2682849 RepID=UPI001365E4D4|nr:hypothetical protein [Paenibacillus sp. MMS18-CY102]MWC30948.1 hypothetical protein [Paenibacillus sp. MMS18-CY102]